MRVRLIYERRGGACFVPHVSLATVFTRSMLRAGLSPALTQGFSPHPRMSFGPELPAGVAALREPVDVWVNDAIDTINLINRLNAALPEGFRVVDASFPEEGSPALGKVCAAALYWARGLTLPPEALLERATAHYGEAVLAAEAGLDVEGDGRRDWLSLTLSAPAQNGIGSWVRSMIASGSLSGWQDLNLVRAEVRLS